MEFTLSEGFFQTTGSCQPVFKGSTAALGTTYTDTLFPKPLLQLCFFLQSFPQIITYTDFPCLMGINGERYKCYSSDFF